MNCASTASAKSSSDAIAIKMVQTGSRMMSKNEPKLDLVRRLVLKLPEVQESTIHGAPSWKLHGTLLACPAIHKSAEPNSLLVKVPPEDRAQLLSAEPDTYYVTNHYRNDSVILVRLSKIDRKSLAALLKKAWQFVGAK